MLSLQKIIAILSGSLLIAIGIHFFLKPFMVLDGGVIGIALIINYIFRIKVGLVIFLCSIPTLLLAWFYCRDIFYNSIYGLIISSLVIDLLEPIQYHFLYFVELTSFSSSVIGGFIIGTGIGIMLRYETSTGGTDLLAQLLSKFSNINVGVFVFVIDGVIICLGGLLLSADTFFLSIFTITAGGVATSLCTMKYS
ncbi:YitT family protein [Paenibacillus alginolyticus]|uniref:YitT family protein n=1 Tax=Paenibacillus alginolyticus TaxID=59839 RepID=UPI00041786AE|nr:YitT family protein [Paenibacillus alginolyticus]MCY9664449.1 YitT family protein [Paenibacillus alginolyticus]